MAPVGLALLQVRATCRWHEENGDSICFRCPQVLTLVPPELTDLTKAATLPGAPLNYPAPGRITFVSASSPISNS